LNFDLLKKLCETPGVSGREEAIRQVVIEEMRPLVDAVQVDAMGSVIGTKRGLGGPRLMVAAHMDEIGFYVRSIDDRGFLRLQPVGGFDSRNLVSQRVHVHGFTGDRLLGVIQSVARVGSAAEADRDKAYSMDELFVDVGMPGDVVRQKAEIGDPVTLARSADQLGGNIVGKALDNRLSVYILLETLRAVGAHQCELFAAVTVQEEVGVRGAPTAAFHLQPDIAIALDVTPARDYPGAADVDQITRLGGGTAIKIMDQSLLCHPKLVRHLRDLAEEHEIPYQLEVLPMGGTDAGMIQRSRAGVPACTLSTPCRYVHTVNEMVSCADIDATISLLREFLEDAHTRRHDYAEES
jgi:endoglucanase